MEPKETSSAEPRYSLFVSDLHSVVGTLVIFQIFILFSGGIDFHFQFNCWHWSIGHPKSVFRCWICIRDLNPVNSGICQVVKPNQNNKTELVFPLLHLSYVSTTFVVESMAIGNALLRWKSGQKPVSLNF